MHAVPHTLVEPRRAGKYASNQTSTAGHTSRSTSAWVLLSNAGLGQLQIADESLQHAADVVNCIPNVHLHLAAQDAELHEQKQGCDAEQAVGFLELSVLAVVLLALGPDNGFDVFHMRRAHDVENPIGDDICGNPTVPGAIVGVVERDEGIAAVEQRQCLFADLAIERQSLWRSVHRIQRPALFHHRDKVGAVLWVVVDGDRLALEFAVLAMFCSIEVAIAMQVVLKELEVGSYRVPFDDEPKLRRQVHEPGGSSTCAFQSCCRDLRLMQHLADKARIPAVWSRREGGTHAVQCPRVFFGGSECLEVVVGASQELELARDC